MAEQSLLCLDKFVEHILVTTDFQLWLYTSEWLIHKVKEPCYAITSAMQGICGASLSDIVVMHSKTNSNGNDEDCKRPS